MRILLIDDNKRLSETIVRGLAGFGFGVDEFNSAADGLAAKNGITYNAIILDLGLPDQDGIDLLAELRHGDPSIPVLILTARDTVDDRVQGLNAGADDYLVKPFAMKELAARLRALLRRPGGVLGSILDIGNITFDSTVQQVRIKGKTISISRGEAAALETLMRHAGKVVSKKSLEDILYGLTQDVTPNAVEAVVSRLRKRLERSGADCIVHTLRGVGYMAGEL